MAATPEVEQNEDDEVDFFPPEVIALIERDNEYDFFHDKRGLAVIINNINFTTTSGNKPRSGGRHDNARLLRMFTTLDFDVRTFTDLTGTQMVDKIREVASGQTYDHSRADCFVCAILTHGNDEYDRHGVPHDVVHGVDGEMVYTRDIVDLLRDKVCPQLKDKPKIFIFQACRGDDLDVGQMVTDVRPVKGQGYNRDTAKGYDDASIPYTESVKSLLEESRDIIISPTPLYKDFLVVYATPPGYSAWRGHNGSYFIQYLEEVFAQLHQENFPLLKTLTRTSYKMAVLFESRTGDSTSGKKQMPCIMSMLTKDICFRKKPVFV